MIVFYFEIFSGAFALFSTDYIYIYFQMYGEIFVLLSRVQDNWRGESSYPVLLTISTNISPYICKRNGYIYYMLLCMLKLHVLAVVILFSFYSVFLGNFVIALLV